LNRILFNGDTSNTYSPTNPYSMEEVVSKTTIFIKNKHASADLKYKILVYADKEDLVGTVIELVSETVLAHGVSIIETLTDPYDAILIQVKNATTDVTSTAKIVINWI